MDVSPKRFVQVGGVTGLASAKILLRQLVRPSSQQIHDVTLWWASRICEICDIQVRAKGVGNIDWCQNIVIVANHRSYADVIALVKSVPRVPVFLAKREFIKIPLLGAAMRQAGHVFVDRKSHSQAVRAVNDASTQIQPGLPLVVFPEGTRTRGEGVGSFKKGGFHLAHAAKAAILPVGIVGADIAWPPSSLTPLSGVIEVRFGTALPFSDYGNLTIEAMATLARQKVIDLVST